MRFLIAILMLCASPLAAENLNCADPITQSDMNRCAHQSYLAADEDLNLAYQMAVAFAKQLDEYLPEGATPAVILLRDAQRAWIPFRDKACELESTIVRGGSMQPLIHASCLERETRARTEALRLFAETN